jgi:hypothetical protein
VLLEAVMPFATARVQLVKENQENPELKSKAN